MPWITARKLPFFTKQESICAMHYSTKTFYYKRRINQCEDFFYIKQKSNIVMHYSRKTSFL